VVLSGCDTGMGEPAHWREVFGLRRSFALAGARTLVMSLWRVPDWETGTVL
jgi:CHAT domain-containing protein